MVWKVLTRGSRAGASCAIAHRHSKTLRPTLVAYILEVLIAWRESFGGVGHHHRCGAEMLGRGRRSGYRVIEPLQLRAGDEKQRFGWHPRRDWIPGG